MGCRRSRGEQVSTKSGSGPPPPPSATAALLRGESRIEIGARITRQRCETSAVAYRPPAAGSRPRAQRPGLQAREQEGQQRSDGPSAQWASSMTRKKDRPPRDWRTASRGHGGLQTRRRGGAMQWVVGSRARPQFEPRRRASGRVRRGARPARAGMRAPTAPSKQPPDDAERELALELGARGAHTRMPRAVADSRTAASTAVFPILAGPRNTHEPATSGAGLVQGAVEVRGFRPSVRGAPCRAAGPPNAFSLVRARAEPNSVLGVGPKRQGGRHGASACPLSPRSPDQPPLGGARYEHRCGRNTSREADRPRVGLRARAALGYEEAGAVQTGLDDGGRL